MSASYSRAGSIVNSSWARPTPRSAKRPTDTKLARSAGGVASAKSEDSTTARSTERHVAGTKGLWVFSWRHVMKTLMSKLVRDEQGGEVLEYALIAGLIVVAAIAVITSVGTKVLARWTSLNSSL